MEIAREAVAAARKQFQDVLIVDTAGRLAIDADMMAEIQALHGASCRPRRRCSSSTA
jgi:signal recognition particle subunit SRP54